MLRRCILLAIAVVAVILLSAFWPRKSAFPPLPEPNGYDVLVRAAAKVVRSEKSLKEMTTNELAAVVATNRVALAELRRALQLPATVPVKMDMDWIAAQATNMSKLKEAAWVMRMEVLYQQRRGEIDPALDESFDLLHLGESVWRGGVLINMLFGTACEAIAVHCMTNLLPSLSSGQCKRLAAELDRREVRRESFDEIMGREKEWQRQTFGLLVRLEQAFTEDILRQKPFDAEKEYHTRVLEVRRLMLAAASRAFELEKGRKPQRVAELVPLYLRALPTDPATGAALELP